ncbi:YGR111W [Saccharomyces arboricola H-6]|uniref:YGR111W n=1 Tax=Saccharomyces arboricola (strain H-6 / AS 2.3317 / CBS 10644) TaxID=1160507 RepID=J8Q1U6_SACAR|nr:YGR111W [Saccharomyces arboricola H-6]
MTASSNKDSLVFECYNDPELKRWTHLANANAWKGLLTVEEYAEREQLLGSSEISHKNKSSGAIAKYPKSYHWLGQKYFNLKDTSLPDNGQFSQVVCSCETLNRIGYCIHPHSNGKIEPALIVCIGGVFTFENNRGKGYAKNMITRLNEFYDNIRNKAGGVLELKNLVINLYSEVGEYYSALGYKSMHVPLHRLTKLDEFAEDYCQEGSDENGKYFGFDGYKHLVKLHDVQFKKSLLNLQKKYPEKFIFTVAPDFDIFKWFHYRDIFIGKKSGREIGENLSFGFALSDNSHIIWHHNWTGDSLVIIKIYIQEESIQGKELKLKQLLRKAIEETKVHGLHELEFWNEEIPIEQYPQLFQVLTKLESKSKIFTENGSISAVRPPKGYTAEQVIWDNNTKFCWF